VHVNWISDQARAYQQLPIRFGIERAHPAVSCDSWLIDWPAGALGGEARRDAPADVPGDLAFRLRAAMLGSFGISAPLGLWTGEDGALAARHVGWYRRHVRPLLMTGDQYWLTPPPPVDPARSDWAAMWFVAKDGGRGVLFAFRLAGAAAAKALALPGLRAGAAYAVRPMEGAERRMAGSALAAGLEVRLAARFRAALVVVEATA
jgi:alpha-galactosidase